MRICVGSRVSRLDVGPQATCHWQAVLMGASASATARRARQVTNGKNGMPAWEDTLDEDEIKVRGASEGAREGCGLRARAARLTRA